MADILSVGIDIGTSTTQLVFSRITMENAAGFFSVPRGPLWIRRSSTKAKSTSRR